MNIVLLGPPGSGKGTQGAALADALQLTHISTGDLLRQAITRDSALGRTVRDTVSSGGLVDDQTMGGLLARAVGDTPRGIVLDGYPRTLAQCETLTRVFGPMGIDLAVEIDVPPALILERVRRRGRPDDDPEIVLRRLWEYERQTRVVSDWFERQARLRRVDGTGSPATVADEVLATVTNWFERLEAPA